MILKPKVAYIEVRYSVKEFLDEWDDTDGEVPTQSDYEDWLIATVMGHLENRKWPQIHLRNP